MSSARHRASVVIALLVLSTANVRAADRSPAEEFLVVAQAHQALEHYAIDITVNFANENTLHAEVECMSFDHCARTIGSLTVLQTPKWTIAADRNRRTLTVASRAAEPTPPPYPDPQKVLAEWLKAGAELSGGEPSAAGQHWVLKPPDRRQPTLEILTDASTHLLRSISYPADADASQRTEILYQWRTSGLDEARLDPLRYIRVKGQEIRAARDYEGYRIVRVESP